MLHPFQKASTRQMALTEPAEETTAGQELFSILCGVNDWLGGECPSVQSSSHGTSIYILYRNVVFPIHDFWDNFGAAVANVSQVWPIFIFGTAQNQETVRLSATIEGGAVQLIQESISGKSTDALATLCLQIDCTDGETAEKLFRLLKSINWQTTIAAMGPKDAAFLREQKLILNPNAGGFFCYAGIDPTLSPSDYLLSLEFTQKILLWSAFLADGIEPAEFEWLADEISNQSIANRMEWELALREAMDQLQFRIVNEQKNFQLFDSTGRRIYFGADDHRAAEWALLKILFPLNY